MFFKPSARSQPRDSRGPAALQDIGQHSLMRMVFATTGITLGLFSVLQFVGGNYLFAGLELALTLLLFWGAWRIVGVRNLLPWIYLYLLPTFSFLLYIMIMPQASQTAFVWVYIIPVLAYLLLGRVRGGLLTLPFVLLATLLYLSKYQVVLDSSGLIDLGNALFCGLLIMVFMHLYETRRAAAHQQLQRMARTDALTGVANRGSFQQALEQSIREAERSQSRLVLVIMDVDHFKAVNDRWGHDAGDQALRQICNSLAQRLRVTDSLGRLGGEEFGMLLRNTDRCGAEPLVEALRQQINASPLQYTGQSIPLSATFGLAEWPVDGRSADELYRCADRRLYRGKQQGRDRLVSRDQELGEGCLE